MRIYRGPEGDKRIWFTDEEIEEIAEVELGRAGFVSTSKAPIVDLEVFIERHLGARLDQHAPLDPDVLGISTFPDGESPIIRINRDLTHEAVDSELASLGTVGRWRATLAHEAGHILLHRVLFEVNPDQQSLFAAANSTEGGPSPGPVRCLKRNLGFSHSVHDWREVQANKAMAALLMSRDLFGAVAREYIGQAISAGAKLVHGTPAGERVIHQLASYFEVSRQAATIRLETLGFVAYLERPELPLVGL